MLDTTAAPDSGLGALRQVPYMGVIYVVAEAVKLGFSFGPPMENLELGLERLEAMLAEG